MEAGEQCPTCGNDFDPMHPCQCRGVQPEIEALLREAQSVRSGAQLVGATARAHHEAGKIEAFQIVLGMIRKSV